MADILYKIHPSIGICRVGNADRSTNNGFFIGPETPGMPGNWNPATGQFLPFKHNGRVKAQAARFRVWEYKRVGEKFVPIRELNLSDPNLVEIEWTVHLANRKAAFFKFDGPNGEADNYASLGLLDMRNSHIPQAQRAAKLEIDEGPKSIHGKDAAPVEFQNSKTAIPIAKFGELRTDDLGRLLVLGGEGNSKSSSSPPTILINYANNDNWFDDISDGPVNAKIRIRGTGGAPQEFDAVGAWVLTGPPDFAPPIGNVVTLYDTLWDVAVREVAIPADNALYEEYAPGKGLALLRQQKEGWAADKLANYSPSFTREVFDIFNRAFAARWVHSGAKPPARPEPPAPPPPSPPSPRPNWHRSMAQEQAAALNQLPGDPNARKAVFSRLRDPDAASLAKSAMPKLLGDHYDGDQVLNNPRFNLSLTRIQHAVMRQWQNGKFLSDWVGAPARPSQPNITPEGLDRAALENCAGGGFFPGIEAGWCLRKKEVFSEPFRIRQGAVLGSLTVRAGFFSQQMALPWQADFLECRKETHANAVYGWWPAQRPDDVLLQENAAMMVDWARGLDIFEDMVEHWSTRGFLVERNAAVIEDEGPGPSVT